MRNKDWINVSKRDPCPLCHKDHWCGRKKGGDAIRCMRVIDTPPGWRIVKECSDGGIVFVPMDGQVARPTCTPQQRKRERPTRDWQAESDRYVKAMTPELLQDAASSLGVSPDALTALGIEWRSAESCYTIPERDAEGRVIGINRRYRDGSQKAIFGGRRGLAVPDGLSDRPDPVLIVEGASDVAACLTIGLTAVGRPNNRGGARYLAQLLAGREVLVIGEHDPKPDGTWPGKDGAIIVARSLSKAWETAVRWTLPPDGAKDIRQWLNDCGLDLQNEADRSKTGRELLESLKRNANAITIKTKSRCNTEEGPRQSQATILRKLIESTGVELFHDPDREAWATIPMGKHRETHHVHTKGFRIWAQGLFYRSEGKTVGSQAVQDALGAIAATAIFDGWQQDVHVRLSDPGQKRSDDGA